MGLNNEYSKATVAETSNTTRIEQLNKQLWNATDKLVRTKDLFAEKKERMTANTLALREE